MNPLVAFTYRPDIAFILICAGTFTIGLLCGVGVAWLARAWHFRRSLDSEVRERLAALSVELATQQRGREMAEDELSRVHALVRAAVTMNGKVVEILTGAHANGGNQDDGNSTPALALPLHIANK